MANDRPVYILPLVDYNVLLPIIDHLYCISSFFIRYYKLLHKSLFRLKSTYYAKFHPPKEIALEM